MSIKKTLTLAPDAIQRYPLYFKYIYYNSMVPRSVERKLFSASKLNPSLIYCRENLNRPISKIIKLK